VSSIAGERTWPELGFRPVREIRGRKENEMDLGFSGSGGDLLIDVGGRRRRSWREECWGNDTEQLSPIGRLKMTWWVLLVRPTEAVSRLGPGWAG
jgi:hypothetical protein